MSALAGVVRRLRTLLRLGVLVSSNDDGAVRTVQASIGDETLSDIEHLEPYGFTSRAAGGAELLIAAFKGSAGHSVALCVGGRSYRLTGLAEGEVAIYDDLGNIVHFLRDHVLVNAVTRLELSAPTIDLIGDVNITGDTVFTGQVTANGKRIDETHTHGGVVPGGGTSGAVS